jgi:hypothetical protein
MMEDTTRPATIEARKTTVATKTAASTLPRLRNALDPIAPTAKATPETAIPPDTSRIEPRISRPPGPFRTAGMLHATQVG